MYVHACKSLFILTSTHGTPPGSITFQLTVMDGEQSGISPGVSPSKMMSFHLPASADFRATT